MPCHDLVARYAAVQRVDATYHLAGKPGTALSAILGVAGQEYAAAGFPLEWQLHHLS